MPLDHMTSISLKTDEDIESYIRKNECFDGRSKRIVAKYFNLESSPMQRYRCLVELCNDRFGKGNINVQSYLKRNDCRVDKDISLERIALRSYSGFKTVKAMLLCNGGC